MVNINLLIQRAQVLKMTQISNFKQDNILIQQNQNQLQTTSSLSTVAKLKRSISHRRKLAKKIPLIKKEIETETNAKQSNERLLQSIIDCDLNNLRQTLGSGANASCKYNNWSLLHYAMYVDQACCGTDQHLEMIAILLDNGAQINSQDEDRWTPLHLACQMGVTRLIS